MPVLTTAIQWPKEGPFSGKQCSVQSVQHCMPDSGIKTLLIKLCVLGLFLMNILVLSMLTIDVGDLISTEQCTSSLLHRLHLSSWLIRPRKQGLLQRAWQHLHETVRVCVAVDAAAMPLSPAQHNQVVLPIAFVHQVPGIPVNTTESVILWGYYHNVCDWEEVVTICEQGQDVLLAKTALDHLIDLFWLPDYNSSKVNGIHVHISSVLAPWL